MAACAISTSCSARSSRAVKEMARLAREENEALKAGIAALEAKLAERSK